MPSPAPTPVRLLGALAIKSQLYALIERFEASRGARVASTFDLNPRVAQRILQGEAFDVGMTNPVYVGQLVHLGKVAGDTHVPFGRIPLAIAIRDGYAGQATKSLDDICSLLRQAKSITYTADGTSGKTFRNVMSRIGVWTEIAPRTQPMGAGQPVRAVAAGAADLAVAPLTTIIAAPGVVPVATFPPDLQADIEISMFLSSEAENDAPARQLLRFLSEPALDADLASNGIIRARGP